MELVEEIKQVTTYPVLIAVDHYNTWDGNSAFTPENAKKGRKYLGFDLCVPRALKFISKKKSENGINQLKNGIFLAATSHKHVEGKQITYENHRRSVPFVLRVPIYSQREYLSAVAYYSSCNQAPTDATLNELLAFRIHSGSIPWLVRREACGFFLPKAMTEMDERVVYSTALNLKELTDGQYEDDMSGYLGGFFDEDEEGGGKGGDDEDEEMAAAESSTGTKGRKAASAAKAKKGKK